MLSLVVSCKNHTRGMKGLSSEALNWCGKCIPCAFVVAELNSSEKAHGTSSWSIELSIHGRFPVRIAGESQPWWLYYFARLILRSSCRPHFTYTVVGSTSMRPGLVDLVITEARYPRPFQQCFILPQNCDYTGRAPEIKGWPFAAFLKLNRTWDVFPWGTCACKMHLIQLLMYSFVHRRTGNWRGEVMKRGGGEKLWELPSDRNDG